MWPSSRHPQPPPRRVLNFRCWTRRRFVLESAAVRVGREAGTRMPSSLTDRGMDHGSHRDQDGSGLKVMVDDMALQHVFSGMVSHRPCGDVHGAAQNPYKHTAGQGSLSETEVGGRPKQMSSSTETRSALPTLQKHAKRPPLEDPPCMCRGSAFLAP